MFQNLPEPKAKEHVEEEQDEFLKKKEETSDNLVKSNNKKESRVRITVPSLKEWDDDEDEPQAKKPKTQLVNIYLLLIFNIFYNKQFYILLKFGTKNKFKKKLTIVLVLFLYF